MLYILRIIFIYEPFLFLTIFFFNFFMASRISRIYTHFQESSNIQQVEVKKAKNRLPTIFLSH